MTWTLTVVRVQPIASGQEATCILSDGSQKFQQSFQTNGTTADLTRQGQSVIATVTAIQAKPELSVGQSIDVTPPVVVVPVPPTPTPLDVQRDQWTAARTIVQQHRRGLDERIPGFDQARIDSAISARDKLYDVSFEVLV